MGICCCSLAGTAACRHCPNNEYAADPIRRNDVVVLVPYLSETTYSTKETTDGTVYSATETVFVGDIGAKKTNGDRFRSMTDEELAEFFWRNDWIYMKTPQEMIAWLKAEVKEECDLSKYV